MRATINSFILFFSICSYINLYGQDNSSATLKIDSLWKEYKKAKHDTIRIKLLNNDIGYLYESINPDSAILCYNKAIEIANKNIAGQTISINSNKKGLAFIFTLLKSNSLNYIGIVQYDHGNYDKALESFFKSLKITKELGDKKRMSACYTNIGLVFKDQGSYDKALEYYLMALKIFEEQNDKKIMSVCYNNIGNVYTNQRIYSKAIEYYLKSLKITEELGDKKGMARCYTNIGVVQMNQGSYDNAIEYYLKSLKIKEEFGDKNGASNCYNNIGIIRSKQGIYTQALEYFLKSLKIKEEFVDKNGIVVCYINIGSLNISLADSAALNENQKLIYLNKAIEYGTKGIKLAQEIKSIPHENEAANTLMRAYESLGNNDIAIKYAKIYIATKESLFSEEKTKSLAEMGTKYEAEKKQLEIEKMQKQKELDNKTMEAQTAENRKQQIIIFSAIGGFLIVLIFSVIILRMFQQKRKANLLLATQNAEIRQQKEEISAQRDEISAQRDTVVIQKDHIEEQKKEITDSINYAKRIQQAVLPSGDYANKILGEHFILFKPKDIVSGDFYWGTRVNEWLIVTVADCTGHGVPGAFMSMLGVSFLNEIVRKKEITKASEILDHLRKSIIEALQQKGNSGEQKDGMDITLCVLNTLDNALQFAGANNPLFIVNAQKELREIESDKQPVAIYANMKPFTNSVIVLQKGDTLYLTSDGYQDQFGGPKNRKFMIKKLKELFVSISDKPINKQREILDTTIENWRGEHEQIDDITILGLRI